MLESTLQTLHHAFQNYDLDSRPQYVHSISFDAACGITAVTTLLACSVHGVVPRIFCKKARKVWMDMCSL